MNGSNPNIHAVSSRFVEINDFTEDFDSPRDFDQWINGRSLIYWNRNLPPVSPHLINPIVGFKSKNKRNACCACGSGKKFKNCCG
jgi:hypothetical protein